MNQKSKKMLAGLLAGMMSLSLLAGCASNEEPQSSSNPSSDLESSSEQQSSKEPQIINPLTGEAGFNEALLTSRPVAIMINNIKEALPQRGLASADIIYELPVEGPVTRLMAVYSDYKNIPEVGSVRSARHDYVELALPLNAFYVHFGKSTQAEQKMKETGIDHVDGTVYTNVAFYFDKARNQSGISDLHCWFTDAEHVQAAVDKLDIDMTMEPISPIFQFASEDGAAPAGTLDAKSVAAPLSGSVTAIFDYDGSSKTYAKGQFGQPHVDELTGKAVSVKNVFLMYSNVSLLDDKHKDVDLSKGTGYYITEGKARAVTFERASQDDLIRVLDEDGNEITVNPGKSWFCIAPSSYLDQAEFS